MRGLLETQENTTTTRHINTPEKRDPNMTASTPATNATNDSQKAPGLISQELWNFFLLQKKAKKRRQPKL